MSKIENVKPQSTPDFDSIRLFNPYGVEYWSARDLMPLLGYDTWQRFEGAIKRAITSFKQANQNVEDHFSRSAKMVKIGSGSQRKVSDYSLSRMACYLIAQNGEPSKPEIAAAQLYFAVSTRKNEVEELYQKQTQRLQLRERIVDGNKSLNEAAAAAGVKSKSFGTFHDAGYKGLYGGLGVEEIKSLKNINPKEDLLDRAGLAELGANALRIGLTEQLLRETNQMGEAQAIQTHNHVGKHIRKAIADTGAKLPEDLPAEPSVKPLLTERKRRKRQSQPPKLNDGENGADQGTLF